MVKSFVLLNTKIEAGNVTSILFLHYSLRNSHLNIALRVLRYLKLACEGVGVYRDTEFSLSVSLSAYVDAGWAKCLTTRRSGYWLFSLFGKTLIS